MRFQEGLATQTTPATKPAITKPKSLPLKFSPYQPDPDRVSALAEQNAGNIVYLRDQVENIRTDSNQLKSQVQQISTNVSTLQDQVHAMVSAQQQYANQMTNNGTPLQITGAVDE